MYFADPIYKEQKKIIERCKTTYTEYMDLEIAVANVILKTFQTQQEVGIKYRKIRIIYNLYKN